MKNKLVIREAIKFDGDPKSINDIIKFMPNSNIEITCIKIKHNGYELYVNIGDYIVKYDNEICIMDSKEFKQRFAEL